MAKKLTEALQNLLGVMQGIRSTNSLDCVKIGKWLFENKQHILPLEEFQTIAAEAIPVLIVEGWVSPGGVISDDDVNNILDHHDKLLKGQEAPCPPACHCHQHHPHGNPNLN